MSYMRPSVLFLSITDLFITCRQTSYICGGKSYFYLIGYCSVHYLSNTRLIRGGKSYFYSILLCSLLVKYTSYTRRQVLFLFITSLFITYQIHVLYAAASPISIQYCSVHYLLNTRLIHGGKSIFLFITALFITYQKINVLYAAASPISIQYCSVLYLLNTRLIHGGKSYFYSLLLYSLLIKKHTSYTRRQVLFLFNTALFITC